MIKGRSGTVYAAVAIVVFMSFFAALVLSQRSPSHTEAADETAALTELLRRAQKVQFQALVNDDASEFPTVFYNDPAYPARGEGWMQIIDRAGAEVINSTIAASEAGPVGADSGFLSAKIAEHIEIWKNSTAWEAIEAKAATEDREPNGDEAAAMPHGETPFPRKTEADWVYVPHHVFDVVVDGNHATAKLAYIEPDQATGDDWILSYGDVYNVFWFTRVDGAWYISYQETVLCPCTNDPPVKP